MKIKSMKIKNFKCLGPDEVKIDLSENIVVLIGENNVGKSAVLEILKYFFSGTKTIPKELFCNELIDKPNAIQVIVEFDGLTKKDKEHQAISPYVQNVDGEETWTLKKKYYYKEEEKADCDYLAKKSNKEWKQNPAGLKQNVDDLFTDEKMQIAFIEAVKDVVEESSAGTKSAFGQIFNMLIREEVEDSKKFLELEKAIKDYKGLFEGKSKLSSINALEKNLNSKLQRVIAAVSKINLEVAPFKDKIMPNPILLTNDQREIDVGPENQGNGFQRALIFCLLEMLAEQASPVDKDIGPRNLILIEEPEIYMHPQMERKIADTLYQIAEDGIAQVICTTHSPVFINIADKHKALVRLTRDKKNQVTLTQAEEIFSKPDKKNKKKRLRLILNFDPAVNEVFFAKRAVLVEGDTEIAVLQEGAKLLGIFNKKKNYHLKRDVTFVNCRGKWTITAFQEVLNHFKIDYVVIHDKDEEDFEEGANARIVELLNGNGKRRKLFKKKIEDQLRISSSNKDKPFRALEAIKKFKKNELEKKIGSYVKFAYGIK